MTRLVWPLVALALLTGPALAQDALELSTDFASGQVYRYSGTVVTTTRAGGAEQVLRQEIELEYEIRTATPLGFSLAARILRLESDDGSFAYPDGPVPPPVARLIDFLAAIDFTYDNDWNLVAVSGFDRILEAFLSDLPVERRHELGLWLDSTLGSVLGLSLRRSETIQAQLFAQGTVREGDVGRTATWVPVLGDLTTQFEVVSFGRWKDRRAIELTFDQSLTPGPLQRWLLRDVSTEGRLSILTNGLPSAARYSQIHTFLGTEVEAQFELELVAITRQG